MSLPRSFSESLVDEGRAWLRKAGDLAGIADGMSTDLCAGSPAETLIAQSTSAQLIVLGSRGLSGFTGLLVGSVAVVLATHGHCPVVVVCGANATDSATRPVVVGVDGSQASEVAVGFACEQASRLEALLIALHAWSDVLPALPTEPSTVDWTATEVAEQRVLAVRLAGEIPGRVHPTGGHPWQAGAQPSRADA